MERCPIPVLKNIYRVASLLHDAGKLSDDFYNYMKSVWEKGDAASKQHVDHSSAGGRIIEVMGGKKLAAYLIAAAIYSHHGLQDCIDADTGESLSEKRWKKEIQYDTVIQRFFQICDLNQFKQYVIEAYKDGEKLDRQIYAFADGKGGQGHVFGSGSFYRGMFERLLLSLLMDSDWTDSGTWMDPLASSQSHLQERDDIWEKAMMNFENYMNTLKQNKESSILDVYRSEISLQCQKMSELSAAVFRLNVPTGGGKTLSSLRYGLYCAKRHHKKHIFYVAPYNSILEQNAEAIRKAVGNSQWVLEHHCNVFYEDEKDEEAYRKLTENWSSPIIVTTAVQMLNTLFSSEKSSIRRMYSLCDSVIIFDEVQAFPAKCTELFNLAVNFLSVFCNTSVVLCSATQPSVVRLKENNVFNCREMVEASPLYEEGFKRVVIEDRTEDIPGGMSVEELSEFTLRAFEAYDSVLVIVNTKKCAKDTFEYLQKAVPEDCLLFHLSTNMCPTHRKKVLEEIKKALSDKKEKEGPFDKKRVICVSTQLVEAGVDFSFNCVIRSMAGLDNVIQAAGRCNRHKSLPYLGKVYIVKLSKEAENTDPMTEICLAKEALEALLCDYRKAPEKYGQTLDSEAAVHVYYEQYYQKLRLRDQHYTRYPYLDWQTNLVELLGDNPVGVNMYRREHSGKMVQSCLNQAFKTAGDAFQVIEEDQKISVVVPYDEIACQALDILDNPYTSLSERKKALRRLQLYCVGVSPALAAKLGDDGIREHGTEGIKVLNMAYYDEKIGITENRH
nr:CRISPR-associated helicase Cas3' [Catenibacillus scindens]